jgi:hypothetical protein
VYVTRTPLKIVVCHLFTLVSRTSGYIYRFLEYACLVGLLADGLRSFTCTLQTFSDGRIKNASFLDNGVEIFHSLKPEFPAWVYSSKWNMLRLVARGSDIRGDETFHIKVSHQGLVIYFK